MKQHILSVVLLGLAPIAFVAGCSVDVDHEPDCGVETCNATYVDCQGACTGDSCRVTCDLDRSACADACTGTADGGTSGSPNVPSTNASAHELALARAHDAAVDCRIPCEEAHTRCMDHCGGNCSIKCAGGSALLVCVAGCRDTECALACDSSCVADCSGSCKGECDTQGERCTRECP